MANYTRKTEYLTKDGHSLDTILQDSVETLNYYNTEMSHPFRDLFVESSSNRTFRTDEYGEMKWDEIGEGEHMGTGAVEAFDIPFNVTEFGRALGWNRHYIERHTREELNAKLTKLLNGYEILERERIMDVALNLAHDGASDLWFQPEDRGGYSFSRTHNHTFASTDDLFVNDPYGTESASAAHTPTQHIRRANAHLRHHGKTPSVVLCSSQFAEKFVDEVAWEADYYFPMAEGLRSRSLSEANTQVDGAVLMQTEWLNDGDGSNGYTFYVVSGGDSKPIKFNQEVPPTITRDEKGSPIIRSDHLFTAHGYTRFGLLGIDPLAVVKVTADNLV